MFSKIPGEPGSRVPGSEIGYMPQELALFPDFTIEETLMFFGRLYHMKDKLIAQRIEFVLKFLDLPEKRRLVGNLSGGQKRRVSLAAALVHNPPLLILDGKQFSLRSQSLLFTHLYSNGKTQQNRLSASIPC